VHCYLVTLVGRHGCQSCCHLVNWILAGGRGVRHPVDQLGRGYVWLLLPVGAVACEVSDLVALVASTAGVSVSTTGGSVSRLSLGNVHLIDVPLFVLHLDRPCLGVSVPPVVVLVGACAVRVYVRRDGGIV
jgi:hypothetical protein